MRSFKRLLIFVALLMLAGVCFSCASAPIKSQLSYDETADVLDNPDRGFYTPVTVMLKDGGMSFADGFNRGLYRLQIGLGEFSTAAGGETRAITVKSLEALSAFLQSMRDAGATAILCFSYDNFKGAPNKEPVLSAITGHIRQLKPIFYGYSDVITVIEAGFMGINGSFIMSSLVSQENLNLVVNQLLAASDDNTFISVRSPSFCYSRLNVDISDLINFRPQKRTDNARVGVFDDMYLKSDDDGGVFKDRNAETVWLYTHAEQSFFGGVAAYNDVGSKVSSKAEYLINEMYKTHTSYISLSSDIRTLAQWKTASHDGDGILYAGKSAYEYIENTLGYRLVLRDSHIAEFAAAGDKLAINLNIENTGCAPVIKNKCAQVVIGNAENTYVYDIDLDITEVKSLSKKDFAFNFDLDKKMKDGEYKVYLRLSSDPLNYKSAIRFANVSMQWNSALCANKIGEIEIK